MRALLLYPPIYIGAKQRQTQDSCCSPQTMEAQEDCWYDPLFVLPDLHTPNPMDQGELHDDDDDDLDIFAILEEAAEVLQHVSDDELMKQETVRITKATKAARED